MLNPQQRAASTHKDGPCLVNAGAGSGKTTVLTTRVQNLLADGVPAHRILCCTFTKKASEEMQKRIKKKTGKSIHAMTLHSLAFRMLKDQMERDKLEVRKDTRWMVERAIHDTRADLSIDDAMQAISLAKSNMQPPEKITDAQIRGLFRCYEQIKQSKNYLDFADLLVRSVERMKTDKDFRRKWQMMYDYIMVDEFQDTSPVQWALVKLLAQRHRNIFCVGDDWQSIYSFQGSNPSIMIHFNKEYQNARIIPLEINYRSRETILNVAEKIISLNQNQLAKTVTAHRKGGTPVTILTAADEEEEAERMVELIQHHRAREPSFPLHEYAILYRTNGQSRPFETALFDANIPYKVHGDTPFFENPQVQVILAAMRMVEAWKEQKEPDAADVTKALRLWVNKYDEIRKAQTEGFLQTSEKFEHVLAHFEVWNELSPSEQMEQIWLSTPEAQRLQVQAGGGAAANITRPAWLESLKKSARKFGSVAGFLTFVDQVLSRTNQNSADDAVQLMTIHKSKGLEFHAVFVADMVEGLVPYKRALEEGNEEEETRLAYVAVTRAKDCLYLCVPEAIGENETEPSRYVTEVEGMVVKNEEN